MDRYYIRDSFGALEYNDNGTTENNIFIALDKKINNVICGIRFIDVLEMEYKRNRENCMHAIENIIDNCMRFNNWQHVKILAEYADLIYKQYEQFYW